MIRRSLGAALWTLVGLLAGFLGALSSLVGTGAGRALLARVSEGALHQGRDGDPATAGEAPRAGRLEPRDRERRPQRAAARPSLRAPRCPALRAAGVLPAGAGHPDRHLPAGHGELGPRGASRGRGGTAAGDRRFDGCAAHARAAATFGPARRARHAPLAAWPAAVRSAAARGLGDAR